jgi:hypothetical protein
MDDHTPKYINVGLFGEIIPDAQVEVDIGSAALDSYLADMTSRASRVVELKEALAQYDLVDSGGDYIVMAERDPKIALEQGMQELGYSSPSPWTSWTREEWNPKLQGREGYVQYYRMKRSDGSVRAALRLLKTPMQAAHWFVEPASDSALDKNIAKFVEENLFDKLNVSWSRFLDDILLMCEYGHMVFEKVFDINDDGKTIIKKLAPRHPLDVQEWLYDANGGPDGVVMLPNDFQGEPGGIFLPIAKLVIFSLEAEAGDLRGTSVLRSAYKHWYFKDNLYKIDAIQKERHGIGVPIIKLPPNWKDRDRRIADEIGRNLRTNERAHVVLPPFWELIFAKLEGQPVDCLPSIDHHDKKISANILAPFSGDGSMHKDGEDIFYKSTRYIAETVCDTINKHVIKQLVDFNWRRGKYPMLRARRIGEWEDARTASFTLRNLVGAGLVRPDDPLEAQLRRDLDLPPMDFATMRDVSTPQGVGTVDPPEQAPAGPPRQGKPNAKPTKANAGKDASGGK